MNGNLYKLTSWIDLQPGGRSAITGMCGRNSTASFTARHGGDTTVAGILMDYQIGRLA